MTPHLGCFLHQVDLGVFCTKRKQNIQSRTLTKKPSKNKLKRHKHRGQPRPSPGPAKKPKNIHSFRGAHLGAQLIHFVTPASLAVTVSASVSASLHYSCFSRPKLTVSTSSNLARKRCGVYSRHNSPCHRSPRAQERERDTNRINQHSPLFFSSHPKYAAGATQSPDPGARAKAELTDASFHPSLAVPKRRDANYTSALLLAPTNKYRQIEVKQR